MKKGQVIWNAEKINIANLIHQGLGNEEIKAQVGCGTDMVNNVRNTLKDGQEPPTQVTPLKEKPKKEPKTAQVAQFTQAVSQTAFLKLVPQVQELPLTPDIYMSYMCAIKLGYDGTIAEWLSLVSRDFWFGRGRNPYEEVSGIGVTEG